MYNGKTFFAKSYGIKKNFYGEIVFNTSNYGYQEVITDPSYFNQILVFSSANVGNTGINIFDNESFRVWVAVIIIKNISSYFSNFNSYDNLINFLKKNNIILLQIKDTRYLIEKIKQLKTNYAYIYFSKKKKIKSNCKKKIKENKSFIWNEINSFKKNNNTFKKKIVILNFGLKLNILRCLAKINFFILVVNYKFYNFKIKSDSVLLSNGPGNPKKYKKQIKLVKKIINKKIPTLGICLGHQLISLALNKKVLKMQIGHHGINHPVRFLNKIFITSQNHNFYVKHNNRSFSLLDKTNQGIYNKKLKIITFQGHPEHCPGPTEAFKIFVFFLNLLNV